MAKYCSNCGYLIDERGICKGCGLKYVSGETTDKDAVYTPVGVYPESKKVDNALVWIACTIPVVGTLFDFGFILFWVVNSFLMYFDEDSLQKNGYDTSSLGYTWFVPVYLYRRAKMLGHSMGYFAVWCISFVISCI